MEDEYMGSAQLLDLSDDVLLHILKYCSSQELKALGFSCWRLARLVDDRSLWTRAEARGAGTGRARWLLARLGAHTRCLHITGLADLNHGCLGYVNRTRKEVEEEQAEKEKRRSEQPADSLDEGFGVHVCAYMGEQGWRQEGQGEARLAPDPQAQYPLFRRHARWHINPHQLPRLTGALSWPEGCETQLTVGPGAPGQCPGPQFTLTHEALRQLKYQCPNLTELHLEYCNINCKPMGISYFPPSLTKLSLRGTRCFNMPLDKSNFFKIHDNLPRLEYLDVSECSWLEPAALLPLSKLTNLTTLRMRRCRHLTEFVAYASLATRYGFRKLKVIDLRESPVGDSEVSALGWLPELEELYLSPPPPEKTPVKEHMHYKGDSLPTYCELLPWELEEPEYFKMKSAQAEYEYSSCKHQACLSEHLYQQRMRAQSMKNLSDHQNDGPKRKYENGSGDNATLNNEPGPSKKRRDFSNGDVKENTESEISKNKDHKICLLEDENDCNPDKDKSNGELESKKNTEQASDVEMLEDKKESDNSDSVSKEDKSKSVKKDSDNDEKKSSERKRKKDSDDDDSDDDDKGASKCKIPVNEGASTSKINKSTQMSNDDDSKWKISDNEAASTSTADKSTQKSNDDQNEHNRGEPSNSAQNGNAPRNENPLNRIPQIMVCPSRPRRSFPATFAMEESKFVTQVTNEHRRGNCLVEHHNTGSSADNVFQIEWAPRTIDNWQDYVHYRRELARRRNQEPAVRNNQNEAGPSDNQNEAGPSNNQNENNPNNAGPSNRIEDPVQNLPQNEGEGAENNENENNQNETGASNKNEGPVKNLSQNQGQGDSNNQNDAGPSNRNGEFARNEASNSQNANVGPDENARAHRIQREEAFLDRIEGLPSAIRRQSNEDENHPRNRFIQELIYPHDRPRPNAPVIIQLRIRDMQNREAEQNANENQHENEIQDQNENQDQNKDQDQNENQVQNENQDQNEIQVQNENQVQNKDQDQNEIQVQNENQDQNEIENQNKNQDQNEIQDQNQNQDQNEDQVQNVIENQNEIPQGHLEPLRLVEQREVHHHVLYVNLNRQPQAVYRLLQHPTQLRRENMFEVDSTTLVTDSAIRRFGRADGEDIVVHIGPNGPFAGNLEAGARPNRTNLRVLSVTGYRHVTDRSLTHLATAAPFLRSIDVSNTSVTRQGVENFRSVRPDVDVTFLID